MGLNADLAKIVQQATAGSLTPGLDVSVEVTLERDTPGAYNPATSAVAITTTTRNARAIPGEVSARRALASGGALVAGDLVFRFAGADLPDGILVGERLKVVGKTLRVFQVEPKQVGPTVLSIAAYAREEGAA